MTIAEAVDRLELERLTGYPRPPAYDDSPQLIAQRLAVLEQM